MSYSVRVVKTIDLFAGAGGLSLGLHQAGFQVVGAIEFDKHACNTYRHNIGDHVIEVDINKCEPKDLDNYMIEQGSIKSRDDIKLVAGGPPCPGFSNIGRSKILSLIKEGTWEGSETRHAFIQDERNQLFRQFIKYVKYFKPQICLMENVSGMNSYKNLDNTPIVEVIKNEFRKIGFQVKTRILLASEHGVPQARKRIFFLGWKNGIKEPNFPDIESFEINASSAISDLPPSWETPIEPKPVRLKRLNEVAKRGTPEHSFLKLMRGAKLPKNGNSNSLNVTLHRSRIVNPRDVGIFPLIKSGENEEKVIFRDLEPSTIDFPDSWRWNKSKGVVWNGRHGKERKEYKWYDPGTFGDKMRRIRGDKPAPTIVAHLTHDGYMFIHPYLNRTITVREAARFQSFPDIFDFSAGGIVPWSKQFKQVGNAVPPLMAKAIGLSIIKSE